MELVKLWTRLLCLKPKARRFIFGNVGGGLKADFYIIVNYDYLQWKYLHLHHASAMYGYILIESLDVLSFSRIKNALNFAHMEILCITAIHLSLSLLVVPQIQYVG